MQKFVPVVSSNGKPLMPTTNRKADKLIEKGRAVRRFDRGLFYIKLLDREDGYVQPVAVGIDPGSKKEAFTVKSSAHTYLNIQTDAVTWVKQSEETSTMMRRTRRSRNTPYRKMRANRNQGKSRIPPSTRARWGWKLRISNWLNRYYPIEMFVVEDIVAVSKKDKRNWNKSFSPLQVGKKWFYDQLGKIAEVRTMRGHETKEARDELGLTKSKEKMSDRFDAHCVDSWTLANKHVGGHTYPDNMDMIRIIPLRFRRRQLHNLVPEKGGIRKRSGSTNSLGFKRGSWISHPKWGVCYVGGNMNGRISLHSFEDARRVTKYAKVEDCKFLTLSSWRMLR